MTNDSARGRLLNLEDAIRNLPEKVRMKLEKSKKAETLLLKRSVVIPFPLEYRIERPTLYYRVSPEVNGIVFAEPIDAEYISDIRNALKKAKTWGEFRVALDDPDEYEEILTISFDDWDEPRPKDSDPFEAGYVPGYCDGDYPERLQEVTACCLPVDILEKYASLQRTTLNGDYYHIDEEHEEAICRDLRAIGFEVIKREDLYFF